MRTIVFGQNMAMVAIGEGIFPCIAVCETLGDLPASGEVSEEEQTHFDENSVCLTFTTQESVLKFMESIQKMVENYVQRLNEDGDEEEDAA